MNIELAKRAADLLDRLLPKPEEHTPELVRKVRDDELLSDPDRDLLTAYSWHLQDHGHTSTRNPKKLLSRFVAYAEAERDAWELGGDAFEVRYGFPPKDLRAFRDVLTICGVETLKRMEEVA